MVTSVRARVLDFAQQIAWDDSRHGSDETAIPRRACRKPATSGALDGRPGTVRSGEVAAGTDLTQNRDECIREAVAMQERVGIGAITDGEYRKRGWREFLYDKCDGFGPGDGGARVSHSAVTTVQPPRQSENPGSQLGSRGVNLYRPTISPRSKP